MGDQLAEQRAKLARYRQARSVLDVTLGPLIGRVMTSPNHAADIPQDEADRIDAAMQDLGKCLDALTPEQREEISRGASGD